MPCQLQHPERILVVAQASSSLNTCNQDQNRKEGFATPDTGRVLIIHNRGDWRSIMYYPTLCIIQQGIVPHRVVPHFSWFFTLFVVPELDSQ